MVVRSSATGSGQRLASNLTFKWRTPGSVGLSFDWGVEVSPGALGTQGWLWLDCSFHLRVPVGARVQQDRPGKR